MKVYTILCTKSIDETSSIILGVFSDRDTCIELIQTHFDKQIEEYEVTDLELKYFYNVDEYESVCCDSYSQETFCINYRIEEFEV